MVSIIIPVYQCKWNIEQIMNDIQNQTFEDYEVLLVDDGSTDGSLEVCQKYEKRDSRVRVIAKEHSGVGATRNVGISNAKGDYIAFIDADDRIDSDYLEKLYEKVEDADLVIASFDRWFYKDSKRINIVENFKIEARIDIKENLGDYFSQLYVTTLIGTVVCKLFSRDIIQKNNIDFRNDIYIGEDFIFNFEYIKKCERINCIPYIGYHYICKEGNSLTHKKDLEKFEYGKILFQESLRFCDEMSISEGESKGMFNLYLRSCFKNIEYLYQMEETMSLKKRYSFIKKVSSDESTKLALKLAQPDSLEFKLYKIILKINVAILTEVFSILRLQYKKMLGRA